MNDASDTNDNLQRRLYEGEHNSGWDENTSFGEEMAHLHEEVSEAFKAWRVRKDCEIWYECTECGRKETTPALTWQCGALSRHPMMTTCIGLMKPQGVPIEFADVMIGLFYNAEREGFDLFEAVELKHAFNKQRSYEAEGRRLHDGVDQDA